MLKIRKNTMQYGSYYFCYEENDQTAVDNEVAKLLDKSLYEYRRKMVNDYNAFVAANASLINFNNITDAEHALEYINSNIKNKI